MIDRLELLIRGTRAWLSRSEWAVRFLHLPRSTDTVTEPGLVMVQIDGLAHRQLEIALENGNMPFLRELIEREEYSLHLLYSGVPSSTPAVQAELFYGVKGAVPAFSFKDRHSGEIVRMFDPATAAALEKKLEPAGEPLLKGGSAYLDIFTGGADESHFCPASLGWGSALRAANPFAVAFLVVSNAYSFVRTVLLLGLELCIAVVDCIRGLIDGRDLVKELTFVPTRVAISVLLRELVTIGAKIDVARGLPIVHLNFLGYDEQAHRRGPTSKFAHWSLKGIDDSIARIWRAARHSARREYDLWIYSDHGQEDTLPYAKLRNQTIDDAVAEVYGRVERDNHARSTDLRLSGSRGV